MPANPRQRTAKRVMVAGIFHETHTFLSRVTRWRDFHVLRGDDVFTARGTRTTLDGFLDAAERHGWEVVPLIHAHAAPSGPVDDDVFAQFWVELEQRIAHVLAEGGADALFLVLHGAMACASIPDVEGTLLERVRRLPGMERLPIFGSMDPHGNVSAAMTTHADGLVAYRENPHADAFQTSVRAAGLLQRCLQTGRRPRMVWLRPPMVWAPPATASAEEPLRSLLAAARAIETAHPQVWCVNLNGGFSYADSPDTGFSISAIIDGATDVGWSELRGLALDAWRQRERSVRTFPEPGELLRRILPATAGPVLLVEPSDNIGGGAPGDGTGLLRALLACDAGSALVAINDPESASACHRRGAGAVVHLALGGHLSPFDEGPVEADWDVISLSDGRFDLEDPQSHLAVITGIHVNMGPCAVVRRGAVTILVTSRATPPFDLGQFRSQGLEPASFKIIGLKAAIGHRRAYEKMARGEFHVETPGACTTNLALLPFQHLKRPVFPLDPHCEWSPPAALSRP